MICCTAPSLLEKEVEDEAPMGIEQSVQVCDATND
jgi:hypothetical protein